MRSTLLISLIFAVSLLLGNLCVQTSAARKVIFYNTKPSVLTSQLLMTQKLNQPCPAGKIRDHRDRCRRAIVFSRKPK